MGFKATPTREERMGRWQGMYVDASGQRHKDARSEPPPVPL